MQSDDHVAGSAGVSRADGHAADEVRSARGGGPAAGGRLVQWACATFGGARADRALHRRTSGAAAVAPARAAASRLTRGPDATALLERALLADAALCGAAVEIDAAAARRWASATFVGARHRVTLSGPADRATLRWISSLPEAEFALRGHLVADLVVESHERSAERFRATIEVLTVEER
jgi:hypothetical protein